MVKNTRSQQPKKKWILGLMGWFVGNEMFVAAGILIVGGGLLLPPKQELWGLN